MCDKMRLVDSELKVMEVLWGAGERTPPAGM